MSTVAEQSRSDTVASIRPFSVSVPEAELTELRRRVKATRLPERETVSDFSQGVPLDTVEKLARYWATEYDWRRVEARLNAVPNFITEIDGLDIHFVHQRSPHPEARPLVITHGWPGSIVEFHKVIEPLSNPTAHGGDAADAFHVVCPTLPGFGFSGKPTATGWGVPKIAEAFATLMARLGYDRYLAQGGDWGSAVTTAIGATDTDHCSAVHVTLAMGARPKIDGDLTPEEQRAVAGATYYRDWDSGYSKQQGTRPQTVGYGLVDSPAAQAAWILEKFWAWTDCDGHPENVLTRDELLDNVMLYWMTASAASSARLYWESFFSIFGGEFDRVEIPTGIAAFPKELIKAPRSWCEPNYNITHWTAMPRGGQWVTENVWHTDEVSMHMSDAVVTDGVLFGNPGQLGIQAVAVGASIVYSGVVSFILLKVIGMVIPLRATSQDETSGLDVTQHGEEAYIHD